MERVAPLLTEICFARESLVYDVNDRVDRMFFPVACVVSAEVLMADGDSVEVGITGREGVTGIGPAMAQAPSRQRCVARVPGAAYALETSAFRELCTTEPALHAAGLSCASGSQNIGARLAACNALHSTQARCARWLLMAHDRVDNTTIHLTQESLAHTLGVRRTSVTVAASALADAGCIGYTRGRITIRDRAALEAAACECYDAIDHDLRDVMRYSCRKSAYVAAPRYAAVG